MRQDSDGPEGANQEMCEPFSLLCFFLHGAYRCGTCKSKTARLRCETLQRGYYSSDRDIQTTVRLNQSKTAKGKERSTVMAS